MRIYHLITVTDFHSIFILISYTAAGEYDFICYYEFLFCFSPKKKNSPTLKIRVLHQLAHPQAFLQYNGVYLGKIKPTQVKAPNKSIEILQQVLISFPYSPFLYTCYRISINKIISGHIPFDCKFSTVPIKSITTVLRKMGFQSDWHNQFCTLVVLYKIVFLFKFKLIDQMMAI